MKNFNINIKLISIFVIYLTAFTISCDEKNEVFLEPDAKLIWTGKYDNGGCGFYVEIDSVLYKPENEGILPPEYQISDTINVSVQYIDLLYEMEYLCGDTPRELKTKAIKLKALDLNQELP